MWVLRLAMQQEQRQCGSARREDAAARGEEKAHIQGSDSTCAQ